MTGRAIEGSACPARTRFAPPNGLIFAPHVSAGRLMLPESLSPARLTAAGDDPADGRAFGRGREVELHACALCGCAYAVER